MQVSVVMATYNGARFLAAQLRSILSQLEPQDELIIVDDASKDETMAVLEAIGDTRLRVQRNPTNRGVLATFERGLRLARYDIVFLADQDDLWLPDKRRTLVAALEADPRCTLALSDAEVIDADARVVAPSFMRLRGGFRGGLLTTLIKNRYLGCTMAFRRRLLDKALPFPADLPMHDMWLGMINTRVGRYTYVPRTLMQYRRHDGNVSPMRRQNWPTLVRWRWCLLKNFLVRASRASRPTIVETT